MNLEKLRARDLMQTDVKVVGKETTIFDAAKKMDKWGVSGLIIEPDEDGDAFGIITRKDIIEAQLSSAINGSAHLVEHMITNPAIIVNPNLSIHNCHRLMRMVGVRRLPVVDGASLVGILSNTDIFGKLVEQIG